MWFGWIFFAGVQIHLVLQRNCDKHRQSVTQLRLYVYIPKCTTIAFSMAISDHTPILITFNQYKKKQKGVPFRYVNNWCYVHGYNNYVIERYTVETWRTVSYKLIHKSQAIKCKLKAWNRSRVKENSINKLHEDFNKAFYQSDQNPEDDVLFDTMYTKSLELNDQLQKQQPFSNSKAKYYGCNKGTRIQSFSMLKYLCDDIVIKFKLFRIHMATMYMTTQLLNSKLLLFTKHFSTGTKIYCI